jgi:hypothetical protein
LADHDPVFEELKKMRDKFYLSDDVLDYTKPWERPPIAAVYSVYGINSKVSCHFTFLQAFYIYRAFFYVDEIPL